MNRESQARSPLSSRLTAPRSAAVACANHGRRATSVFALGARSSPVRRSRSSRRTVCAANHRHDRARAAREPAKRPTRRDARVRRPTGGRRPRPPRNNHRPRPCASAGSGPARVRPAGTIGCTEDGPPQDTGPGRCGRPATPATGRRPASPSSSRWPARRERRSLHLPPDQPPPLVEEYHECSAPLASSFDDRRLLRPVADQRAGEAA